MIPDLFVGELAAELLRQLYQVSSKCAKCKSTADDVMRMIKSILPTVEEIKYSGVELPAERQIQLDQFSQLLRWGTKLAEKAQKHSRWNVYRNLHLARKMDDFRNKVDKFVKGPMSAQAWADIHRILDNQTVRFDKLEHMMASMNIDRQQSQKVLVNEYPVINMEEETTTNLGNLGLSLELGKRKVKQMLLANKGDKRIYGITGIGGSGKTTLARQVSTDPEIKAHFKQVFMLTVSQSPNLGLKISHIIEVFKMSYGNRRIALGSPESNIGEKLLILDDVWDQTTLDNLVSGVSRIPKLTILVVSRSRFQNLTETYEMQLMQDDEAMSLFCISAFGQKTIRPGFDKALVQQIVNECKGLPLALEVIGASLRDQDEKCWKSARKQLSKGEPISETHENQLVERIAMSVERLNPTLKECFMDLGSFPEDKKIPLDVLVNMWVEIHDLDPERAFAVLVELSNKNLLKLVKDARAGDLDKGYNDMFVTQHDVLRDIAIHLSNQGDVNERKRLFMPKRDRELPREWEKNADQPFKARIVSVYTEQMDEMDWFQMEFPKAEVLILNISASSYFLPPFIDDMPKLRAIIIINNTTEHTILNNSLVFSNLTELRSIWLEKVQVPALSNTTSPLRKLSKISLVLCNFSDSFNQAFLELPKIFPRLEDLTIDLCDDLAILPPTICNSHSLRTLSITNCPNLCSLPTELGCLRSLETLRLYACPGLNKLPPGICQLSSLKYLDLSQCVSLTALPNAIGNLSRLEIMDLTECYMILDLPESVSSLKSLRRVRCENDDEILFQWKEVAKIVPDLHVQAPEKCFSLDWLDD